MPGVLVKVTFHYYFILMITLGIETSCDETACGIVGDDATILANEIYQQLKQHEIYGGVVPEIAARAHLEKITPVTQAAIRKSGVCLDNIDLIAFTRGPGLIGPLLVGASFAQGLARVINKPVTGICHLEGHLAAAYLSEKSLKPPFLCLTVSGGHTELCRVDNGFKYTVIGRTRDDAAGEAFDKCGKLLNLGYPAGPILSKLAESGDRNSIPLPRALNIKGNYEFSFSGLKTALFRAIQNLGPDQAESKKNDICASLESAIVEILVKKSMAALISNKLETLAVCGGVSANSHLRDRMQAEAAKKGLRAIFPHISLCTDNGTMIAAMAHLKHKMGHLSTNLCVSPSLSWE